MLLLPAVKRSTRWKKCVPLATVDAVNVIMADQEAASKIKTVSFVTKHNIEYICIFRRNTLPVEFCSRQNQRSFVRLADANDVKQDYGGFCFLRFLWKRLI